MNKYLCLGFTLLLAAASAVAQQCPRPYVNQDRTRLHAFLAGGLQAPDGNSVTPALRRMHTIALQVLLGDFSHFQREAFNYEYLAYLSELDNLGRTGIRGVNPRTNRFVAQVVNQTNLGLAGTTIQGDTDEQAKTNAANAASAVFNALHLLWNCF